MGYYIHKKCHLQRPNRRTAIKGPICELLRLGPQISDSSSSAMEIDGALKIYSEVQLHKLFLRCQFQRPTTL